MASIFSMDLKDQDYNLHSVWNEDFYINSNIILSAFVLSIIYNSFNKFKFKFDFSTMLKSSQSF